MAKKSKVISSYLGGWSEAQYRGTDGTFNSSIAIDPDHSLGISDIRTSGMLVPVVYEKFSSTGVIGNIKWLITNPKDTKIYAYSDNPTATSQEFSLTTFASDANLKAYWKLEDVNATTGGFTLTNNNTVTFAAGKFTNAADFGSTNTNKYLSVASDSIFAAASYSWSLWVNAANLSSVQTFIGKDKNAASSRQFDISVATTGHIGVEHYSSGNTQYLINTTDNPITAGAWYHIAVVNSSGTFTIYVNNVSASKTTTGTYGSMQDSSGSALNIGRREYGGSEQYFSGLIDDVAYFNRALSSSEVSDIYISGGKFLSYSSALGSETVVSSPANGTGNGLAYYNNYIYIATNTDIARYGPLNGTPSYTAGVWTGATLGTQTALTNTIYGFQSSYAFPNHAMVVHGDGALYVCDYINGAGKIHRVKTTKTTYEGDTNNSSLYGALTLPFGYLPTDIQSWGTDLAILAVQTTDTVLNQGRAALFFWDGAATTFHKGPLFLPDSIATALEVLNGQLYIFSGNASGGVRISKYIGGDSIQEVLFQEEGTPPPPGATSVYGNRIYWGNHITYPEDVLGVFSYGSKTEKIPSGLHCVARANNTTPTMPAITALIPAQQANGSRNRLLVAWRDSAGYGIDKYSTTGTHVAVWRSDLENVGGKFKITRIRIPLGAAVATNMEIVPKIYLDDLSTSVTLATISTTLYDGARKVVYHGLELNECIGQDNFLLELNWSGTVALPVTAPIIIEYETYDDENISS